MQKKMIFKKNLKGNGISNSTSTKQDTIVVYNKFILEMKNTCKKKTTKISQIKYNNRKITMKLSLHITSSLWRWIK